MPTYRKIIGRLSRMQFREDTRYQPDGTPYIVRTQIPDEVIEPGDLFEPSQSEIEAFSDLMEFVSDEPFNPPQSLAAAPAVGTASDRRLNPELYAIIKRANTGTAIADEQQVSGDILDYMEKHAQGTATEEDTATLELVLTDFGLPLFVG